MQIFCIIKCSGLSFRLNNAEYLFHAGLVLERSRTQMLRALWEVCHNCPYIQDTFWTVSAEKTSINRHDDGDDDDDDDDDDL